MIASTKPSFERRCRSGRAALLASAFATVLLLLLLLLATAAQADFGFLPGEEGFSVRASKESGSQDTQAGSHPYALTTTLNLNLGAESFTDGDLRDLHLEYPPGLIENPSAIPRCTLAQFNTPRQSPFEASHSGESCPDKTQIGVVAVHSSFGGGATRTFGVFNLAPPPGFLAQIGFAPFGVPITLTPHIRQAEGEYGITLALANFSQRLDLYGFKLTLWGTPWASGHDPERGNCLNEANPLASFGNCSTGSPLLSPPQAYLTLPTSCAGPMDFSLSADSWQQPTQVQDAFQSHDKEGHPLALTGCELLGFFPLPSAQPSTDRASSATGFDFNFDLNDAGITRPEGHAQSPIKKAVVALPEGITVNPSVGAGLGVCTPAGYAAETASSPPGAGCPNASKIGSALIESPLLEEPLRGALFFAQPDDPASATPGAENPFDSLLALYIVAKAPERGILVRVAGRVSADPQSGRLVVTFDNLPQLPYSHFNVHFREGQRSPLLTPPACGSYVTHLVLTPWLDPTAISRVDAPFSLTKGIGGGPCPTASQPFAPQAQAGTLNSNAGSYTPFYLHLRRTDSEAEITSYSAQLPPGLSGKLAGIPYCPEAAIAAAKAMSGTEEAEHPSCPAASEIGHTVSGFGVGTVLAYAPGRLYLAGPYHGSAFSIVAIDSATVGPFDLGTIIVRSAIRVDPQSAQVTIDSAASDPIPHIIDGFPLRLRDIRVYVDRPDFTLNPTSCEPFSVTSSLTGSSTPFTDPEDRSASAADHFQVAFCSELRFAPRLAISLKGPTHRGASPALRAVYRPRPHDANAAAAAVTLPPSEFLAEAHLRGICTNAELREEACPADSVYGHARAFTPLLGEPLQGPVYLRSSTNPLPDLVAVLHGAGIRIVLQAQIDSSHGGVRASFQALPDAPLSKFVITIDGGPRGILVNAADLCAAPQLAGARLIGQNNRGERLALALGTDCPRHRRAGGT